ncbi:hypothetical protein POPTR_010G112701v4 [Populus trichocarpa]|uniref:Uncharacterized protein n=1 Tax=Populus trichocarpa TaxID=3694 RepID=A0ACC0SCU2_POPTR|nr:hypothetical protein BDE02_10G100000 [Populus trichocarpa]KAI9387034.1 hypothetical protein POPTR_010G112701v4 [Populus trichocarpa]
MVHSPSPGIKRMQGLWIGKRALMRKVNGP